MLLEINGNYLYFYDNSVNFLRRIRDFNKPAIFLKVYYVVNM